jgi:hypothetical protein
VPLSNLTAAQLAARTHCAVAAAVQGGRALGLTVSDREVLHDAFSVIVRLVLEQWRRSPFAGGLTDGPAK